MVVGQRVPRIDAFGKVTGQANYPADLIRPDMLHVSTVFARRAHARITAIDLGAISSAPGVVAVLTAADVPYNRFGLDIEDQPVLCEDVVRHFGDRVAIVVAESASAARRAAQLASKYVSYEDLPIVSDPEAAMRPHATRVHADRGNLIYHQRIVKGDVDAALEECDVVIESTFSTSWQEHAFLQPEAAISFIDEQDRLVVVTAGQWLHEDRRQLAKILGVEEDRVVVRYAKIGGAFGGREDLTIQSLVALATWKLKRPAAIQWNREESIIGHPKRHPFVMTATWGAARDGTIKAVRTKLVADGGAYASTSPGVLKVAITTVHGPYEIDNILTDGYVNYTNNPPSGAFRGFGAPQSHFVAETMITRVAHALELDPLAVRRKNLYREGSIEATGSALPSGVHLHELLERCVKEVQLHFSPGRRNGVQLTRKRGIGFACGMKSVGYPFGYPERATATVELSGVAGAMRARVRAGAADVGQGSHTILRQVAAEALSVPLDAIDLVSEDSAEATNVGSASASRMTLVVGRAVKDAAEAALQQLALGFPGVATVEYRTPVTTELDALGRGAPNFCYGYVAQAVEVDVDMKTGIVELRKIISAHDVGKAINPQQVEGQIEGCLAQAIGYTLTEDFRVERGIVATRHFSTYLLPTALDVPVDIYPIIVENPDINGPFGARGVAEMALVPFAAAVANAIYDATGVWVQDLPFTPERVLHALSRNGIDQRPLVPAQ
jgi:CO/xanthine dehydrogenase Mo-binding subunit